MIRALGRNLSSILFPIEEELDKLKMQYEIKGRPKSIYSIWNKMRKQNIPFDEVYDLFAIRIIMDTPLEHEKSICWQVYSLLQIIIPQTPTVYAIGLVHLNQMDTSPSYNRNGQKWAVG